MHGHSTVLSPAEQSPIVRLVSPFIDHHLHTVHRHLGRRSTRDAQARQGVPAEPHGTQRALEPPGSTASTSWPVCRGIRLGCRPPIECSTSLEALGGKVELQTPSMPDGAVARGNAHHVSACLRMSLALGV